MKLQHTVRLYICFLKNNLRKKFTRNSTTNFHEKSIILPY